jgi:septal ring factor EnvC (AmiA/AmiB activator)
MSLFAYIPVPPLTEVNAAEQKSQIEGLRRAIGEVEKEQRHEREKVSGLQEAMGEMRRQMSQTEEAVERRSDWRRLRIVRLGSNQMSQVCGQ